MQIHEKLKIMRQLKNWSQEDMAEKLGYSVSGYAKIERGETELSLTKLEQIAKTVGIELQQLIGLSENNIFNIIESIENSPHQGNIVLSETQCAHELEKANLLINERDKQIESLNQQIEQLKEINALLKANKT